jgi:hypothetical protein
MQELASFAAHLHRFSERIMLVCLRGRNDQVYIVLGDEKVRKGAEGRA